MDLKLKDLINLLKLPEKKILRLVKLDEIPAYKIRNEYRFNRQEIIEWIVKNKIEISRNNLNLLVLGKIPVSIKELVQKGGVITKVKGSNIVDIINDAVEKINTPGEISKEKIIENLLAREEIMPTSIGKGIAIPHPRTPIITDIDNERISICYLMNELSYHAIDGLNVHTLFIILSANQRRHLEILSKISYLCQQDDFIGMLKSREAKKAIINYIEEKEKSWNR